MELQTLTRVVINNGHNPCPNLTGQSKLTTVSKDEGRIVANGLNLQAVITTLNHLAECMYQNLAHEGLKQKNE